MNNNFYTDKDSDIESLLNKKIGFIGFGNQGSAQAKNLKDSGLNIKIALREDSKTIDNVVKSGFNLASIDELIGWADIISIQIPDINVPDVIRYIIKSKRNNLIILLSHAYAISYNEFLSESNLEFILVAPSAPGYIVRSKFVSGTGVPGLIAVSRNDILDIALAYSKGIGLTRVGVYLTTFDIETKTDLFGEQAVLVGGLYALITKSFKILIDNGYDPKISWLVCFYELKNIVDTVHRIGFHKFFTEISHNAKIGAEKAISSSFGDAINREMKKIFIDIDNGSFKEYIDSDIANYNFKNFLKDLEDSEFNKTHESMINIIYNNESK